ncbi:MAG: tetratricopeptide repeat protein [Nitrososphaerales archaeon]
MINSAEDEHLWSETYDRELKDVFEIQSDISERVADALKVELLSEEKKRLDSPPTSNIEAYTLYLKGRYYWNERTKEGIDKAILYFMECIKRDPNYSRAYSGLADCYSIMENWGYMSPGDASEKVKIYALKALELDDTLAEAHASLAVILMNHERNWDGAEREYKRAIELNPNYASAHHWYGHALLGTQGRYEEAIYELTEAKKLDPLSLIIASNLGDVLLSAGRYKEAEDHYRSVLETSPSFAYAHSRLGLALLQQSRHDEAITEIEKSKSLDKDIDVSTPDLVYAYMISGREVDAEKLLAELEIKSTQKYVPNVMLALANAAVGKKDRAIEWLRKAAAERSNQLTTNLIEPEFDELRSDPRFQDLLRLIGLRRES